MAIDTNTGATASKSCVLLCGLLCAVALLSACGDRQADGMQMREQAEPLPQPDKPGGSLTGMSSKPGPGDVPLAGEPPPPPVVIVPEDQVDLLNPETGMLPGAAAATVDGNQAAAAGEPTSQDAVAVIHDYYASIESHSYSRAYALWSDGGRASRQTPQQFADGFADTAHVEATVGEPGNEDAGAGQRYLQVPVAVTATRADGSVHRFAGQYTLHRTVVDGATAEQRAWRIASADLREVKP